VIRFRYMALWFSGRSECSICGLVLNSDQDVIGHPHVLPPDHPLWRFSDSAMHRICYERWEHHDYFESVLLKYKELFESRPGPRLGVEEIIALSKEERARLAQDIDKWEARASEAWKSILSALGAPKAPTCGQKKSH
jgi:hypothetical protein